jgi:hypothetical protein
VVLGLISEIDDVAVTLAFHFGCVESRVILSPLYFNTGKALVRLEDVALHLQSKGNHFPQACYS